MATLFSTGVENLRITASGIYYGWRKVNGRVVTQSFHTKSLREAKEKLRDWLGTDKAQLASNRTIRCAEAHAAFIATGYGPKGKTGKLLAEGTKVGYESLWRNYAAPTLGHLRVIDVEPFHIIAVLDKAKKAGVSPSNLRNIYVSMGSFFEMCTREPTNYRPDNPVHRIGPQNTPPVPETTRIGDDVVLSRQEIETIAGNFAKPSTGGGFKPSLWIPIVMRALFLFLCQSGLRISEALALKVSDVLYPTGQLHAVGTLPFIVEVTEQRAHGHRVNGDKPKTARLKGDVGKTVGTARRIPLSPFIARVLGEYIEAGLASGHLVPGGLLFPNTRQQMFTPTQVRDRIRAAAKRGGVTRYITTHFTRHTYLSSLVENGANDLNEVAEIAGHDVEVLKTKYLHRLQESESYKRIAAAGWQ